METLKFKYLTGNAGHVALFSLNGSTALANLIGTG